MAKNTFDSALKEALGTIKTIKSEMTDIDKKILAAAKSAKKLSDIPLSKGTPKEVDSQIQKSTTFRKQLNAQIKEEERLTKALESAKAKFYSAQSGENRQLQQIRKETNLLNKEKREEAELNSKLVGAYRKASIQLNQMRRAYKDLAIKKEQGIKLTRQEEKQMESLTGDIRKYDNALKKVDGAVGQHQRKVGQYSNALKGLKNVMVSMVGAFGVVEGLRMGFNYAKEAVEVAKAAKGVEFAFKRLGTAGEDAFQNIKKSTRGLVSDLDIKTALNEFQNFNINLEQTDTLFEFLAVRAAQTGKSVDKLKESLVEGLAKESKLRIDNLGISTADLNAELKKTPDFAQAVANIAKREIAKAGNILDDAANSTEKWSVSLKNAQLAFGKLLSSSNIPILGNLADLINDFAKSMDFFRVSLNAAKKGIDNFIRPIGDLINKFPVLQKAVSVTGDILNSLFKILGTPTIKGFSFALLGVAGIFSGLGNVIRETKDDVKEFISLLAASASLLLKPIDSVKELGVEGIKNIANDIKGKFNDIGKSAGEAFKEGYKDVFINPDDLVEENEKEEEEENGEPKGKRGKIESSLVKRQELIIGTIDFYDKLIAKIEEANQTEQDATIIKKNLEQIKNLKDAIEVLKGNTFAGIELEIGTDQLQFALNSKIPDMMSKLANTLEADSGDLMKEFLSQYEWDYENFKKFSEKKMQQAVEENTLKKEKLADWMQYAGDVIYEIGSLAMAFSDRKIQKYEDEIAANNEMYDAIINNEETTDQQRKEAEIEKAEREEKLQKKIAKEKEKQAKIDKATAAFSIAINTAAAVIRTFAQLGFPAGVPAAIAVGALGAIQLATVLAKPIPKYKHGRKGGKAELAEVGDGGKSEVVTDSKGNLKYITPDKPTYTYLDKGDSVISSVPEYLEGLTLEKLNQASIMASLQSQSRALNQKETRENLDREILKAIQEGNDKKQVMPPAPDYGRLATEMAKELWLNKKANV